MTADGTGRMSSMDTMTAPQEEIEGVHVEVGQPAPKQTDPHLKSAELVTFLAGLHPDTFITEAALARGFACSTRTIRRWRREGVLPPCDPKLRRWRVGNILDWLIARAKAEEAPVWDRLVKMGALRPQ